jgi:hypothetical protein
MVMILLCQLLEDSASEQRKVCHSRPPSHLSFLKRSNVFTAPAQHMDESKDEPQNANNNNSIGSQVEEVSISHQQRLWDHSKDIDAFFHPAGLVASKQKC